MERDAKIDDYKTNIIKDSIVQRFLFYSNL